MVVENIYPQEKISNDLNNSQVMSMSELLAQQEHSFPVIKSDEIIRGVVVSKRPFEILIDIGAKSEGIVDARDLSNLSAEEIAEISVGDTVPVYVLSTTDDEDNEEDQIMLSLSQARIERDWDDAQRMFTAGETIERVVIGHNKGGLIVDFGQLRGFVPGSLLVSGVQTTGPGKANRWSQMIGRELSLKVIEVDREKNRLILSERAVVDETRREEAQQKSEFLATLSEGETRKGQVTRLVDFGAFVDIGGDVEGLIHLSELAWARILHPKEVLNIGDEVEVYVLNIDVPQHRVALSLKRLQPEPWDDVFQYYQVGQVVDAVITKLAEFGAFARIDDRIEGLIHISEMSNKNISHSKQVVAEGQQIKVKIIHIDPERRRMGLSIKQLDESVEEDQEVQSVVEETQAIVEETQPVVEEVQAIVEETQPIVEETQLVFKETEAIVAEVQPIVEETQPIVEEVQPIVEETQARLI